MALEVIGAGFGRTGTSSLKQALEDLGFGPCYHMVELIGHPEHAAMWEAAMDGKDVDWDNLFRGYRSTMDWPAAEFYEQLMEHYPDAKVILTLRDPDRWYESARQTIYAIYKVTTSPPISWLPRFTTPMQGVSLMIARLVWQRVFDGKFENRQYAIEVFERANDEVQWRVPPERLLVFDVTQGWEPLCAFLDVPVPQGKPFPHLNDTADFRKLIHAIRAVSIGVPLAAGALAGIALLARALRDDD